MKYKYEILLILFIISLISSAILSFNPTSEICEPGSGCEVIHASKYDFTFGIQNSHYGVIIFIFMIFLTYSQIKKPKKNKRLLIHIGIILGAIIAVYFIYLQQFVIKSYCKYCMVIDISMLIALVIIIFTKRKRWKNLLKG